MAAAVSLQATGVQVEAPEQEVILPAHGMAKVVWEATAQPAERADLIFAERFGVFEAAKEKGVLAFGNMSDQNAMAPSVVITGPIWDMYPTIQFAIDMVKKKAFVSMDLGEWSMMAKGGSRLAPFHSFEKTLPAEVIKEVRDLEQKILAGTYRVPVDEQKPVSD